MRKRKQIDPETAERIRKFAITCYAKSCDDIFEKSSLICCNKCRRCYHTFCNDPPLSYDIVSRYIWHCNKCKMCVICCNEDKNIESTLIICDACDRAFHLDCIGHLSTQIPEGNWYCDECQYCKTCEVKLSQTEVFMNNYSIEGNKQCKHCLDKRIFFDKLTSHLNSTNNLNSTSSTSTNTTTNTSTSITTRGTTNTTTNSTISITTRGTTSITSTTSSNNTTSVNSGSTNKGYKRSINIAAIVINNQRKYVEIKEFCCVCSGTIEASITPGNSRVTCKQCTLGSHTRCSHREDNRGCLHEVASWICKSCHKIKLSQTNINI